ncbi:MAG TPA: hypothetical protein VEB22_01665 [Phycisphaerales bacterium]|nr:hypothetical protein [Phycisphaerales bacterium]
MPHALTLTPVCSLGAQIPEALYNLPWLVQVPVALALIAGVVLWLAGRRLIRPVTIMIGLGLGGVLGFLVLPVVMPGVAISPYLGLAGGAAAGLTIALLLYQVATAITFGSAIGAGCGVTAAAVLGTALTLPASAQLEDPVLPLPSEAPAQLGGGEQPLYVPPPAPWNPHIEPLPEPDVGPEGADVQNPGVIRAKPVHKPKPTTTHAPAKIAKPKGTSAKPSAKRAGSADAPKTARPAAATTGKSARAGAGSAAGRVGQFWQAARATWGGWWDSVPERNKPWIIGATVVGVAAGTVLGLLLPAWSAGAVTALAGAAIWIPAAVWLGTAWAAPGFTARGAGTVHALSPGGWIAVWLVIAIIGVACQWYGLMPGGKGKGKAKKRKPRDHDEE